MIGRQQEKKPVKNSSQELKLLLGFPIWQLVPFPPLVGGWHRLYGDRDLFGLLSPCSPRNSMDARGNRQCRWDRARVSDVLALAGADRLTHVPLAAERYLLVPCRSPSELVIPSGEINTGFPTRRRVDWGCHRWDICLTSSPTQRIDWPLQDIAKLVRNGDTSARAFVLVCITSKTRH